MNRMEKMISAVVVTGALVGCVSTKNRYVGPPKKDIAALCSEGCAVETSTAYVSSHAVAPVKTDASIGYVPSSAVAPVGTWVRHEKTYTTKDGKHVKIEGETYVLPK